MTVTDMIAVTKLAEQLGQLDCTHRSDIDAVSDYLLANLPISRTDRRRRGEADREMVGRVILAYAKLLQDAGVRV